MPKNALLIRSSELDKFLRCRRSWMLSYVRQLETDWHSRLRPRPFDVGNAVHAGLEAFYPDHDIDSAHLAITAHRTEMYENLHEDADMAAWDTTYRQAHAMVGHYPAWLDDGGYDIQEETVAIEERMFGYLGDFDGVPVVLHGQPDHVKSGHNGLILEDWKTGKIDRPLLMENDWQLLNYAWLVRETYGCLPVEIRHRRFNVSLHTDRVKKPQYSEQAVHFSARRVETHVEHLRTVCAEIVRLRQVLDAKIIDPVVACTPTRLPTSCNWDCAYVPVCGQMDDGDDWEHTLEISYRKREEVL
jgi:hypothetical protein